MLSKMMKALRGDRRQLEAMSVEELEVARREAQAGAHENRRAVEQLERADLAGADDEALEAHRLELERARLRVRSTGDTARAIDAALRIARKREEEAAAERDAAAIGDELRETLDEHDEFFSALSVSRIRVQRLAERLTHESVRRRLTADPTVGLRPRLQSALGDQIPPLLRRIFDESLSLEIPPPGPKEGDLRRFYGGDTPPGGREEIYEAERWVPHSSTAHVRRVVHPGYGAPESQERLQRKKRGG